MKIEIFHEREIEKFTWNEKSGNFIFEARYRSKIYRYIIHANDLILEQQQAIKRFKDGTHHLFMILTDKEDFVTFKTSKRIAKQGIAIDKYVDREHIPMPYINYYQYRLFTQLDGITTIVGMSGAGKTYSALSMLPMYARHFDKIAYLNYELTERDIIKRFKSMFHDKKTQEEVISKLYMKEGVMTSLDLEDILGAMDVMPEDKVVFIVDNVGSVIGQEDNVYQKQNEFLKHLDVICKEREYHALALTQTVKDHNADFFDENGAVKATVNMSIMAGSIMLGNLSRSVLFTGYNGKTQEFRVKVLKKGTGKTYSESGFDSNEDIVRI